MPDQDRTQLTELSAHAEDFFVHFPSPLALLGDDGEAAMNERFTQLFDPACLQSAGLLAVARNPGQPWQPVHITSRQGGGVDVQALALRVQDSTMLLIADGPIALHDAELAQMRQRIAQLERTSTTDHLTGAWNRAHFDRVIESELSRSLRYQQPLSLIMIDIDHFKQINDTHGHQAGDTVLRELVALLRQGIRASDALFRWGGEEFVVLAVSTGHRNAQVFAENMRAKVAAHAFAGVGALTISLGVAEHLGSESAAAWFQRLDAALYAAKDGGRNRVVTDRCGSSDIWTWESGLSALHLVWQDGYDSGHPRIDAEHRELFTLANTLIDAALAEPGTGSGLDAALDNLLTHVQQHFADEEAILADRGYVRLDAHKAAHAALLKKAGELKLAAGSGEVTAGAIVEFLARDVVARHMLAADRDFFPLFSADGRNVRP